MHKPIKFFFCISKTWLNLLGICRNQFIIFLLCVVFLVLLKIRAFFAIFRLIFTLNLSSGLQSASPESRWPLIRHLTYIYRALDLSRPASSTTAFTIDFQNAFENSYYVSASLHESSNGKDPGDSLISSPLLQEYIATQNIQQETKGTNFPPNVLGSTCVDLLICRSQNWDLTT